MWTIIFSTLAIANPEDIESLGNKNTSSKNPQEAKEKNKESKKQEDEDKKRLEEELEEEEMEEEELEQQLWEQEELERQEENANFNNYNIDDQDNFENFGTPNDLEYQEELDTNLFESNSKDLVNEDNLDSTSKKGTLDQQTDTKNTVHQAVYDITSQDDLTDEERAELEKDQAVNEDAIRKKYQQNLNQDEILFSSLQNSKDETEGSTQESTEEPPNFGSEYKGEQDPNVYKSGLTTYQEVQTEELKKSDGFNPYNSEDTFSVQANDGVDNMYRPENSKGFTVGLNHDFENPYDVENLLNQNSTLQNSVRPASEVSIEGVPEISYGGKISTSNTVNPTNIETSSSQSPKEKSPNSKQINTTYKPKVTTQTETMSLPDISKEYRLGSGDTITIYAWSGDFIERNISKNYVVADTGYIQLPIVGSVRIGNLTTSEASALITDALGEYIKNPIVQLQMSRPQSQKIWLLGNISRPGIVYLDGPKTLIQALSERGLTRRKRGNGAWAETKIHIQREDGTILIVDTENLLETGEGNLYLRGGDSIFISDGSYIYLNGKFKRSGPVAFSEGMTVTDACAEAMGYEEEANLRKLYINRNGKQLEIDLKAIFQGEAEDVILEQGDRLYLEESIW